MLLGHILRKFDSDNLIDRFSSMGNSIMLYTVWQLSINLTKNKYPKRTEDASCGNLHLSFFDIEKKRKGDFPVTKISQYLTTFESLLLIGVIDDIEFSFIEHAEHNDSTNEFLNIKIWKDDIRKESYDTMPLWEAGRDNVDIICYIWASYKLNLWIAKKFIEVSILKWKNNKTTDSKIDFWTSKKQLEIVWQVLINWFETFGERKFEIKKVDLSNNTNVDLFSTLLYLSDKHCIKLYECWRSIHWSNKIPTEFFVEILDINELRVLLWVDQPIAYTEKIKNTEIIQFLEKIDNCKKLLSEWVLETKKEQDLITEIRAFQYETTTDNEIFLLKIKKLKAHPQSIWSSHRSRWFSSIISPYILEWEAVFLDYLHWGKLLDKNNVTDWKEGVTVNIKNDHSFVFDKKTWKVFLQGIMVDEIWIDTNGYRFIEYLYDNKGDICKYNNLKNHINPRKVSDTDSKYCQKIKGALHQSIKKLIKAKRVGFLLDIS